MKKIILNLVLILVSTTVFSQVTVSPGIKIGLILKNEDLVENLKELIVSFRAKGEEFKEVLTLQKKRRLLP